MRSSKMKYVRCASGSQASATADAKAKRTVSEPQTNVRKVKAISFVGIRLLSAIYHLDKNRSETPLLDLCKGGVNCSRA